MNPDTMSARKKVLWSLLFLMIAGGTVFAVVSQSRAFTLESFGDYVTGMSVPWLLAAAAAMLGFVLFEGEALVAVCHTFGYRASSRRGFVYAASDIYFSAITPSATGGQPACAYFMVKDGIPPIVSAIALLLNLTMYTASILLLGIVTLLVHPQLFLEFSLPSQVLIVLGYAMQILLAVGFLLLLCKASLLHAICRKGLRLLCKLRILRHEEQKRARLAEMMQEYAECAKMIAARKGMMAKALVCNLLQRASLISVPLFVFLASGGERANAARIWAVQCFAVIGSNTVPIPGAMGVSDFIMLDGFSQLLPESVVINFELLSRSMSFYACVILCGLVTLASYLMRRRRARLG